jgi:hypothetical protein
MSNNQFFGGVVDVESTDGSVDGSMSPASNIHSAFSFGGIGSDDSDDDSVMGGDDESISSENDNLDQVASGGFIENVHETQDPPSFNTNNESSLFETESVGDVDESSLFETESVGGVDESSLFETESVGDVDESSLFETESVGDVDESPFFETKYVGGVATKNSLIDSSSLTKTIKPNQTHHIKQIAAGSVESALSEFFTTNV